MKKLTALFMLIVIAVIFVIMFTGCKARQVASEKKAFNHSVDSTHSEEKQSSSIDTSKVHTETKAVTADSSHTEVDIETDSGITTHLHVNPDGSMDFTGKAKGIKVIGAKTRHADQQQVIDQQKGKSEQQSSKEQTTDKEKTAITDNKKQVKSSIDIGKTIELGCVILLILAIVFIVIKRFNVLSIIKNLFNK